MEGSMKIENVQREPFVVEDWEFLFLAAPDDPYGVTLDLEMGDTCEFRPDLGIATIKLTEKKSYVGGDPIPAETHYIPIKDAIVKTRRRTVEAPPLEVVAEWQRMLEELQTPDKAN